MLQGLPKEYAWVGLGAAPARFDRRCIAVTNEEMDEIWQLLPVATPIEIEP